LPENQIYTLIIKTQAGLEQLLAEEVTSCGGQSVEIINRAVKCTGSKTVMYRLNYFSRTALRVLREIKTFDVDSEAQLYERVKRFSWKYFMTPDQSFAINATVNKSNMEHSHYVALKTKDAVADYFREETGKRPDVDVNNPDIRIQVHITGTKCTLLLDSSGESLHKRGYRLRQGKAPINEVLAAGMILLSGWDGKTNLIDPMCGSGTILCEAAMIARKMPAGYFRKDYGFKHWLDFDKEIWKTIVEEENAKIMEQPAKIYGNDVNQNVLALAEETVNEAGFAKGIELKQVAFENSNPPNEGGGVIITNPPYGERIKKSDMLAFYKMIGDTLKTRYSGYNAWLITSHFDALKSVGLKTSKKIKLYNGPLECRFVKYELYKGSRKNKD
jgi:putative N6-adenine-specific DNA methylase